MCFYDVSLHLLLYSCLSHVVSLCPQKLCPIRLCRGYGVLWTIVSLCHLLLVALHLNLNSDYKAYTAVVRTCYTSQVAGPLTEWPWRVQSPAIKHVKPLPEIPFGFMSRPVSEDCA